MSKTKRVKIDSLLQEEHRLALIKSNELKASYNISIRKIQRSIGKKNRNYDKVLNSFLSTVIFAQYEAGTGVCIDKCGTILTCAHCVEFGLNSIKVVLTPLGIIYEARCIKYDTECDLALLQVISSDIDFSYISVIDFNVENNDSVMCFGQAGQDDLETTKAKVKTNYPYLEVSKGYYLGLNLDCTDPYDNKDIGQMSHSAWTYWGHSGAPLISTTEGLLLALHSSWDSDTETRHGIPLCAILKFLSLPLQ